MLKLYTKDVCPFCTTAKDYLINLEIQFEEVNVQQDQGAREFLINEGHRTVPQIYYGNHQYIPGGCSALLGLTKDEIQLLTGGGDVNQ